MEQIEKELETANQWMERLGCPVLNVSDKSIEETAGVIMGLLSEKQRQG